MTFFGAYGDGGGGVAFHSAPRFSRSWCWRPARWRLWHRRYTCTTYHHHHHLKRWRQQRNSRENCGPNFFSSCTFAFARSRTNPSKEDTTTKEEEKSCSSCWPAILATTHDPRNSKSSESAAASVKDVVTPSKK